MDLDATDDPLYGNQEGRFFHGYYGCYCYLPLYIFCGKHLLCAKLRPSGIVASQGSKEEIERIVDHIRKEWPKVKFILRGDSGFAGEELMGWCETKSVDYIFGFAKNARLEKMIESEQEEAREGYEQTTQVFRVYKDFIYRTLDSWSKERRVIGKAEHLAKGANPRFVVTSLTQDEIGEKRLYEKKYCARGEMENRIKEQQLYLFAGRTSTETTIIEWYYRASIKDSIVHRAKDVRKNVRKASPFTDDRIEGGVKKAMDGWMDRHSQMNLIVKLIEVYLK